MVEYLETNVKMNDKPKSYFELVKEIAILKDINNELTNKVNILELEVKSLKQMSSNIDVIGWKGKSGMVFEKEKSEWIIREWRKEKETDEIKESVHRVSRENVKNLWTIIKQMCPGIGTSVKYRQLIPEIIKFYKWEDVDLESFNGGKNRSSRLFPYYYYPVKILENLKYVSYGGAGVVTRLTMEGNER